ncbi:MAG: enoyl-CoA hydratase/isomerase family protein [Acidimicrobiales bacterium]|jgi:enoyl-CoA hydratase|nr:enoyl-CoA hydratase/isomerase family protein [Acidimicrobiales bacterium]HMS87174.1 enoyl-CoA hydratase-related protein [Acidimicrobiales bacterium]
MPLVRVDRPADHIAVVTLDRPEVLNALSIDLAIELDRTLLEVSRDNTVRVIVLTGAGRAFCSGLDLKDYGVVPDIDGLQVGQIAQRSMRVYSRLVSTLRSLHQPVIAAVNGPAFGGGMCLALACDLRFAGPTATFNATGIVNGLTSTEMAAAWLLPRQIGATHANDLLLTGRVVEADEAVRIGLVSRLADDVMAEALATAGRMAGFSPYGLAMTKDVLWANLEIGSLAAAVELEDRNQLMLGFTDNLPEAIRAFGQDRRPVYTDEPRRDLFTPPA